MIPDIRVHSDCGTLINEVLTFNRNVNIKIHINVDQMIRSGLYLSLLSKLLPKITGKTGKTHGANTESIHEKNEIIISWIMGYWLK